MMTVIRGVRLCLSLSIIYVSSCILIRNSSYLFEDSPSYVVINGFGSTWAMVSLCLIGMLALTMTIATKGSWRTSKFNRRYILAGVITCLVISPLISILFTYSLHGKAEGFIECEELRDTSRRYSSKTYAVTQQECQRLGSDKQAVKKRPEKAFMWKS